MSRKYIKELLSQNFVYPNNTVPEYDLEIVHDINNNPVSGTVATFSAILTSSTSMVINISGTWSLNGAEPYINQSGNVNIYSVHMMDKNQNYYRPWSCVYNKSIITGVTSYTYSDSFTVTPSMVGVSSFTDGTYYFEVRMIGHRSVFPICVTASAATGPTPTPTSTGCTQSNVCAAIVVTGATAPESYAGTISYNNCDGVLVNENFVNGGTYYRCIEYVSGVIQVFEQTGISSVTIYGGNCNTFSCPTGTTLTPTPTSSSTPTPTPTVTAGGTKSLQIYGRDIDGTPSTLTLFYSKNGGGNINVPGATGTQLPGTCSFIYTITGLTTGDSIVFGTSVACVMNGNGSSSSCPSSSGSATTFTYVIDAPTTQQVALTINSGIIP